MKNKPWSIGTLKERLKYYQQLLTKTDDPQEQKRLTIIIKSYQYFIKDLTTPIKKASYSSICKGDQKSVKLLNETLPILIDASNTLFQSNITLPNRLFSINTSKDTILKKTKHFYNIIGGIYKEKYDEYYDTNAIYINFNSPYDSLLCGNIIRPRGVTECFINISLFNNPHDIVSSIHEHAHAIATSICEEHIEHPLLNEVETIFFELLSIDMLDKNTYTKEQIKNLREVIIGTYNRILKSIEIKNMTTIKGIYDPSKAKKIIKERYSLEDEIINNILYSPLSTYLNYGLSYLIAIELYSIYKKCNSKALNILEEIIRIDTEEEDIILKTLQELGITPGNNFRKFNRELIKTK